MPFSKPDYWADLAAVSKRSPFVSSPLSPDSCEQKTKLFLEMFGLAVETSDDAEEQWAYQGMKAAYLELMGHPPIDPVRQLPAGLWEAMEWAAQWRVTRERVLSRAGSAGGDRA